MLAMLLLNRNENHPRAQLRYAKISRSENFPLDKISHPIELLTQISPIRIKFSIKESADIFQHHRSRPTFIDQPERLWEKIALITGPKLFTRHRERRTRDSPG